MRYYLNDRRGFTLVEVLVTTVLLGIIVTTVSPLVKSTFGNWESAKSQVEIQSNLRQVADYVAKELRQAQADVITVSDTDPSKIIYANSSSHQYFQIYLENKIVKQRPMELDSEENLVAKEPITELTSPEVVVEDMEFVCIESENADDRDQYVVALSGRFETSGVSTKVLIRVTPRVDGVVKDTVYDEIHE